MDSYLYNGGMYEYYQSKAEDGLKLRISDYDHKAAIWHSVFMKYLPNKDDLPLVDGAAKVLELGCNTGYTTRELENIYDVAVGIDSNSRLIEASKLNHDKCYVMRAEWLDFEDGSFSAVFAKDVYEHCQFPDEALESTYRVLADGGYVVAMIPLDGDCIGIDDIATHECFNFNNKSHVWKATAKGAINRFFSCGFTDIELWMYNHSDLFGEFRDFGDTVLVIRARKVEGITKVPLLWLTNYPDSYWAAFLTFNCTGNCEYCIQNLCPSEFSKAKFLYSKNEISGREWVSFYNNLQKYKFQRLGIIGGEPTIHTDFIEIVNGIEGYLKTVTTNLKTPLFDDIDRLKQSMENIRTLRINTSFHPHIISVDEFCGKIHKLRDEGFNVDQISMVDCPASNFRYYYDEFIGRGLTLSPQTYLGKVGDMLLPNPDSDMAKDYGEHGIKNFELYNEGFSCRKKESLMCMTRRFLVSPDGGIYKCHYHLYSRRNSLGNIVDLELPTSNDYSLCEDFGFCNPCDYPHTKFKPIQANMHEVLSGIIKDPNIVTGLLDYYNTQTPDEFKTIIGEVLDILYCSDEPYWVLYNNPRIKKLVNDYLMDASIYDNTKERYFAQLDGSLYRYLPNGVNIYRILDDIPLLKYIDALGSLIHNVIAEYHPSRDMLFEEPFLTKALDSFSSSVQVTCGTVYASDGTFILWDNEEESTPEEEIENE